MTTSRSLTVTAVALGVLLTGCAEAIPEPAETTTVRSTSTAPSTEDPRGAVVAQQLSALTATVTAARDHLQDVQDAGDLGAAHHAADAAVASLTAASDLGAGGGTTAMGGAGTAASPTPGGTASPTPGEVAPLFPGRESSRQETIDYGDVFTRLLTAARSTSTGDDRVVSLLREQVAGDLGTWQRSPGALLDQVVQASRAADREQAILGLPGEGTRALAWSVVASSARTLDDARQAAERGTAHLQIILDAIHDLTEDR